MRNQTTVSRLGIATKPKLLLLYTLIFITLLSTSCDGQASNTAMFEIKRGDQKSYMLKDCRKMSANDIHCKCVHLDRECQQVDVENCTNCSCLNGSARIFYIKKRYGALCLSPNNLFNAGKYCL